MDTETADPDTGSTSPDAIEPVLTLSELAAHLAGPPDRSLHAVAL